MFRMGEIRRDEIKLENPKKKKNCYIEFAGTIKRSRWERQREAK